MDFLEACTIGNVKRVKELLKDSQIDPSYDNNRALQNACGYGNLEVVKELLKDPCVDPLDQQEGLFCNSIECAINYGRLEVVKELLKDSRTNSCDRHWLIFFAIQSYNGSLEIVKELLKNSNLSVDNSLIRSAIQHNRLDILIELLKDPRLDKFPSIYSHWDPSIRILIKDHLSKKSLLWFNEEIEYLITN